MSHILSVKLLTTNWGPSNWVSRNTATRAHTDTLSFCRSAIAKSTDVAVLDVAVLVGSSVVIPVGEFALTVNRQPTVPNRN